jgi:uncharacterized protein involved in outer membrane biogenesis
MRKKWLLIIPPAVIIIVILAVIVILSRYDFNKLKPKIENAAYEATGRKLTLAGDIELKIGFTPSLVIEDVRFQNAKWGSKPDAVSVKRFEVKVALLPLIGGNISVKRLVLIEPDILVETSKAGKSNLAFKPDKPKAKTELKKGDEPRPAKGEPKLLALMVGEVLIKDGRLTYKDGQTGKTSSVKLTQLHIVGSGIKRPIDIDLKGSVDDKSFGVSARLDSLAKLTDPSKGHVKITSLNLVLGKSTIKGSVDVDISANIPKVVIDLSSDNLNLGEFHEKSAEGSGKKPMKKAQKKKKVFSSEPIDIGSLKRVDLELGFKAKKFVLPALALNDLNLKMTLKNGRLKIKPLTANVGGGKLDVGVDLRPKGKVLLLDARVKVNGLDLARMGKELKLTEVLNGKIDADVKVKGSGTSVASLMASLDGDKKVLMGRGEIDNKFLKFMGGDLGTNILGLLNPLAEKEDYTVVNCMVVDFGITDGLAKSRALVFDTSYMSVVGDGKVDLRTEKLDISLNPQPKEGLSGGGLGKLTMSLGELARAFKLGGTLANPKLAVDTGQTVMTLGKALGGKALFGPLGIATALVGTSKDDPNPCLSAIEEAKKSAKAKPAVKKETTKEPALPVPEELKDVGEGLKKLFGQ